MADPLTINVQQAAKAAPAVYTVPGAVEVEPLAAFATFDGTGAAASFLPSLAFYSASGLLIARAFPSSTVAAGGSADVSYFPGVGAATTASTGSATMPVPVILDTPDVNGDGYPDLSTARGFTNIRRVVPALDHATLVGVATWEGSIQVPTNYSSSPSINLVLVANNAAAGKAARIRVSSAVVALGSSEDTAYTDEAYVNISVPATANQRFDRAYALSTAVAAGSTLNVKVSRDANNAADTLTTVSVLIWACSFSYTAA